MIYQDPLGALDRRMPVAAQVREPLDIHAIGTASDRDARVGELLQAVGLSASVNETLSARTLGWTAPARGFGARSDHPARPSRLR